MLSLADLFYQRTVVAGLDGEKFAHRVTFIHKVYLLLKAFSLNQRVQDHDTTHHAIRADLEEVHVEPLAPHTQGSKTGPGKDLCLTLT